MFLFSPLLSGCHITGSEADEGSGGRRGGQETKKRVSRCPNLKSQRKMSLTKQVTVISHSHLSKVVFHPTHPPKTFQAIFIIFYLMEFQDLLTTQVIFLG